MLTPFELTVSVVEGQAKGIENFADKKAVLLCHLQQIVILNLSFVLLDLKIGYVQYFGVKEKQTKKGLAVNVHSV